MERVTKIAQNGNGEFFVHVYCADGSVCGYGPFSCYNEAKQIKTDIDTGEYWKDSYNIEDYNIEE